MSTALTTNGLVCHRSGSISLTTVGLICIDSLVDAIKICLFGALFSEGLSAGIAESLMTATVTSAPLSPGFCEQDDLSATLSDSDRLSGFTEDCD